MEADEAFTAARNIILKILPKSRSEAKKFREAMKSATIAGKIAKRALESLIEEGKVEIVPGKWKSDTKRYCISIVHEQKS